MPTSLSITPKQREKARERYAALDATSRAVVQMASIIYEPVPRATLLSCLDTIGVKNTEPMATTTTAKSRSRTDNARSFTASTFNDILTPLFKNTLLETSMMGVTCGDAIVEIATRDAIKCGQFKEMVEVVHHYMPVKQRFSYGGPRYFSSERQFIREIRVSIYSQEGVEAIESLFQEYYAYGTRSVMLSVQGCINQIADNPFDREWLESLEDSYLQKIILSSVLSSSIMELNNVEDAIGLLHDHCEEEDADMGTLLSYADMMLIRGDLDSAQSVIAKMPQAAEEVGYPLNAAIAFLKGDNARALVLFRETLAHYRKTVGKRKIFFRMPVGFLFVLALIKEGTSDSLKEAMDYVTIARKEKLPLGSTYNTLDTFLQIQQGTFSKKSTLLDDVPGLLGDSWTILISALCIYWSDRDEAAKRLQPGVKGLFDRARENGFLWFAMESAELLARITESSDDPDESEKWQTIADTLRDRSSYESVVDLIAPQEAWEQSLAALTNLTGIVPASSGSKASSRIIWTLTPMGKSYSLQPKEQSLSAKGTWNKGRPIALKRLRGTPDEISALTAQDLRIATTYIKAETYGYYNKPEYLWADDAILGLVGHPLVFFEANPSIAIEVVKGFPEILVSKIKGGKLALSFSPKLPAYENTIVTKETPTRIKIIEITPDHRRINEILGSKNKLEVPETAKDKVLEAIGSISSLVTVQSDIGGGMSNAEEVPTISTPHVHLLPSGEGLRLSMLISPFGNGGTYYRPGVGGETVIAEVEGKRLQTTRDLKAEKQMAQLAIAACPTLAEWEEIQGEWVIETAEASLELLLQLRELGDRAIVEWPQGEKMRVSNSAGFDNLHMKLKSQNEWFTASGELRLPDGSVIEMQNLLRLLNQSTGRFISLGDGEFIALTNEFRRRLEELRDYSESTRDGLRFNKLTAPTIEDWIDDVGSLEADKAWKEQIARIQELRDYQPELPTTLQAELRDYQVEGFTWLARLAKWGVGACLADDMGLGKTLQTLALMLVRAPQGPTLAIAPTSVCMNWLSEAQKFAPTLNPIQFGSGNRQKVLDELKPFDLVVCSYGLLQQEEVAEMLAKIQWQTIVLDEAQSIKNFATKRSQAAMNLQGEFKLLTTGTPIENHLGELWNLFRFINPGLLGSLDQFNQRYANAIEKGLDKKVRDRLRKLIQPFILRRTKTQVLQELPSRTEIVLNAELSKEEMVFYEALRREVIAKLEESEAPAGQKHLQVLAEIMRLRRACCNTQLVKPEIAIPSSKLEVFANIVTELLENHHKALVFSQFVDHLSLIRAYLDEQGIRYQYLDGSTPMKDRKKRVDAFQSGEGDIFLISLKAGGTGLNLTAADYVIHMDPWWNPAVEDQASDRAHRMGQKRPVTIYRIVAKDTIEEKIVQLHQQKRALADSLLEGTEMSGKMNTNDLIKMIQER